MEERKERQWLILKRKRQALTVKSRYHDVPSLAKLIRHEQGSPQTIVFAIYYNWAEECRSLECPGSSLHHLRFITSV